MKKFVSLLLVLMFSFGMVSTVRQEKAEAASIVIGYAVFKAGIAFTGFATYAGWLYANGYTQPIQEMIVGYANRYYDYSNGVYTAKVDKMNILDKFNLYTSALITGNLANLPNVNDLKEMQNELSDAFPQRLNMDNFTYDEMYYSSGTLYGTTLLSYSGGYYNIKPEYTGKIVKHVLNLSSWPDFYYYIKMSPVGWYQVGSQFYPIVQVIQADGKVINIKMRNILQMFNYSDETQTFDLVTRDSKTTDIIATYAGMLKANYGLTIPVDYGVTAGSYARGEHDFVYTNPNYYSLLNGLSASADDLPNLLNTDEYLQREVSQALENSNVNEESPAIAPAIGTDGMVYYPGTETIPDNPDIPYNPGSTWYENLFNKVGAIPDLLLGLPDLIGEKIAGVPILGDIVTTGQTIVGKLIDIGESITGFIWGILQQILDAILGLPAKLIELLKDALIWLFVPDATFMQGKIDEFKLNFAFIDTFTDFIKRLEDMTSSNAVPTVSVDLSKFKGSFGGKPISMGSEAYILDMRWYLPFKVMGDLMFTAFVYVMFIWRFFGRLPEIISGGGLLYTADSKTDDLVRKLEGKKK